MTLGSDIGAVGGFFVGTFQGLVNALGQRVPIDVMPLPVGPVGDVLDPRNEDQRIGARVMEDFVDGLLGTRHQVSPQAARATRPLLATARIEGAGPAGVTSLRFDADAPGCDWAIASRAAAVVAVYVDGRYHSSVVVQHERTGGYAINLGALPAGQHEVELRAATDLVGPAVALPTVAGVRAEQLTGEQAWIDAHAPIVEMMSTDPGAARSVATHGAPVLMIPAVTRHPDGSKTVEYRVLFTHEEGGTTDPDLFARHGRAVDSEYMYRVTVDANGTIVDEQYQSAIHKWHAFTGTREQGRPVLRVSTPNHMFSDSYHGVDRERWSASCTPALTAEQSEYSTMLANPWTWQLMAKELRRGGNIALEDAVRGVRQIADPSRYAYLDSMSPAVRDAAIAAGRIEFVLRDGRHVTSATPKGFGSGYFARAAVELPAGVGAGDVRSVVLAGVKALVFDDALLPRELELLTAA